MASPGETQRRHRGDREAFSANQQCQPNRDRIKATVALLDLAGLATRIAGWLLSWVRCGLPPYFVHQLLSSFPLPSASSLFSFNPFLLALSLHEVFAFFVDWVFIRHSFFLFFSDGFYFSFLFHVSLLIRL